MCRLSSCCTVPRPKRGVSKSVAEAHAAMDKAMEESYHSDILSGFMDTKNSKPLSVVADVHKNPNFLMMDSVVEDSDHSSVLVRMSSSTTSTCLYGDDAETPSATEPVQTTPEPESKTIPVETTNQSTQHAVSVTSSGAQVAPLQSSSGTQHLLESSQKAVQATVDERSRGTSAEPTVQYKGIQCAVDTSVAASQAVPSTKTMGIQACEDTKIKGTQHDLVCANASVQTDDQHNEGKDQGSQSDAIAPAADVPGHISSVVQQWITKEIAGDMGSTILNEIDNKVRGFLSEMKDIYGKPVEKALAGVQPETSLIPLDANVDSADVPPKANGFDSFQTPRSLTAIDGSVDAHWPPISIRIQSSSPGDEVPGPSGITTRLPTENEYVEGQLAGTSENGTGVPNVEVPLIDKRDIEWQKTEQGAPWILGTGSFGIVQAAYLKSANGSKLPVVIKENIHDDQEEVMKEGKMMQYLNHTDVFPRFYGCVDLGFLKPKFGLVSELFGTGVTLSSILLCSDFHIRPKDWLNICVQLVQGLRTIHGQDVILNDLKDNNVLVDISSLPLVVKYIDLGYSSLHRGITFDPLTEHIQACRHLAPEVKDGQPTSFMSDIWGIGIILSDIATMSGPAELDTVARTALVDDPQQRASLDDILTTLDTIISDLSSQSTNVVPAGFLEDIFN